MADQAPPAQQPAAPQAAPPQQEQRANVNVGALHEHAIQAEKHLEQLATGLAAVGAPPEAVKSLAKMADVVRGLAQRLGKPQQDQAPQPQPSQPQQRPTMQSATNDMQAELRARRQQGG